MSPLEIFDVMVDSLQRVVRRNSHSNLSIIPMVRFLGNLGVPESSRSKRAYVCFLIASHRP